MPICRHCRLELGETSDVAHALILDMHPHVELFRKRQQVFEGFAQVVHAIAVIGEITEDTKVARAEDVRRRERLDIALVRRSIAELETELVAFGPRRLA